MGFHGLKEFNRKIRRAAKAMPDELYPLFLGKLGLEVLKGTVEMSPVDEGTLRGSFDLNLDRAVDKTHPDDKTGTATIQRATLVADKVTRQTERMAVSSAAIHAPIIEKGRHRGESAEDGTAGRMYGSRQAPRGMLGVTIRRLSRALPPASVKREIDAKAREAGMEP